MNSILSWITFIPFLGGVLILFYPKKSEWAIKWTALVASGIALVVSLLALRRFNPATAEFQFVELCSWIPSLGINYFVGVDGLSMTMVILTTVISFLAVIASFNITHRWKEYFSLYLLLETAMTGVFISLDLFLFYVFWEVVLVPMYFLIGIWGGPRREYAAIKFFLYTLAGSVLMLLGILALYFTSSPHTFSIFELTKIHPNDPRFYLWGVNWVFLAFYIGFAIKVPAFPFHTWLPDAHVEAPTAISVILAGVLLKMGLYGILRVSYQIFPEAARWFAPYLAIIATINIVYGAFVSMAQTDFKKMIAYSSVNHMGYCLLGLSALTLTGFNGAVFEMWNHGIITGSLFMLVGVLYDRSHTRGLDDFGGLGSKVPVYAGVLSVASFASLGLPGLAGFVSEFMCFLGAFKPSTVLNPTFFRTVTMVSTLGIVITAAYVLRLYQRSMTGPLKPDLVGMKDLGGREITALVPIAALTIVLGIFPAPILNVVNPAVDRVMISIGATDPAPTVGLTSLEGTNK
jgi:NADH-quinone oxidoreductase subunit M